MSANSGMGIGIERYHAGLRGCWDQVLSCAKNGIFQFDRGYIEYHGDRFEDMSSVAYLNHRPVAIMPAAFDRAARRVVSHPGLTFGGPVFVRELRSEIGLEIIAALLGTLRGWGATSCLVKLLPAAFASYPSAEVDYALWRHGFNLVRRDLSSLLPLAGAIPFNKLKSRAVRKARNHGLRVSEVPISDFHGLLHEVLRSQHGLSPVHSRDELGLLHRRFPDHIMVRGALLDGRLLAGALVFKYGHLWHTQYLASSGEGRGLGALDLVIAELIQEAMAAGVNALSLGTSTLDHGRELNQGLLWQKESYGARSLVHDFMEGTL